MAQLLRYSTEGVHPRDRLNSWIELVTKPYVTHNFRSHAGASFEGRISAGPLAGLGVAAVTCSAMEGERTARHVSRDYTDDFLLRLQIAGTSIWEQNGRQIICRENDFVLVDMARPFLVVAPANVSVVSLSIPRQALGARLGSLSALSGSHNDGRHALVRLVSGFLAGLPEQIDGIGASTASKLSEHTLDLVALAVADAAQRKGPVVSSTRSIALLRLKVAIAERLYNPEIRPADVASAAKLSVRYANDLLSDEGTSIERYIVAQRLDRCRLALEDPAHAGRTIAEIAYGWGFSDPSHFCRRFKAEYGLLPKDYRQRALEGSA